ncbi:MAG: helix-turn-helix domain-containing protein [Actinomycetota bacterium]|nr:helix-turn-helix domain-containing protein [Actinomycetota bacterium]
MKLTEELNNFILDWGEKLSHWGLNRTECQVYSLLFISPEPLTIEEITATLNVARSNVSNSLKELLSWKIVSLVNKSGDRRKYYECIKNVWQLFNQVVSEQKRREIDPMMDIVHKTKEQLASKKEKSSSEEYALERIKDIQGFFDITTNLYSRFERINPESLNKYLKLADNVNRLIKKG